MNLSLQLLWMSQKAMAPKADGSETDEIGIYEYPFVVVSH